jgi:UDP-N-acetylglucosamine 3-dehydrogenase
MVLSTDKRQGSAMANEVAVAVIGCGSMGRNHARVYSESVGVELCAVLDADIRAAEAVGAKYACRAYSSIDAMLRTERLDAVTVAVPTVAHHDVSLKVISAGLHVLVEKPIAFSIDEGADMIRAASEAGVALMVGHVERFNPAVLQLKKRLDERQLGRVFQIDARRLGPFPARMQDVGVVLDLAVHDLDVFRFLTGAEVIRVFGETERRIHSTHEDLLSGLARMSDGTVGTIAVNWLTPTKVRELTVTGERGMFRVDYLTQDLYFYENAVAGGDQWETLRALRGVSEGSMTRYIVEKREPLHLEIDAFLAAVRGDASRLVRGEDGLRALMLARAFVESGLEAKVVGPPSD